MAGASLPGDAMLPSLGPVEMTVSTGDGVVLKGVLEYPDGTAGRSVPLAVLAHQYPATADSYAPLIEDLLEMGVAALAFDLRGHGSSIHTASGPLVIDAPLGFTVDDFGAAFMGSITKVRFDRIDDDIVRVAAWGAVQNYVDASRILLVGASIGGSGALLAAPRVKGLAGVATLGAAGAPAFGLDGPDRIRRIVEEIGRPCYLASSREDSFAGADNVENWSRGLSHVSTRLVPGGAHAMGIYYDVRDELLEFVGRALKP